MEQNKHALAELEKFRIDYMYGKKKHYNARDRYAKYHRNLGLSIIVLTAFMGTSVYYSLSESELLLPKIIIGILIVAVAVLAAIQTFMNFEKRALSHKITADRYLCLMKESQLIISYCKDGNRTIEVIQKEIERLCQEVRNVQKDEPEVSSKDYRKAREGVKDGEEIYTPAERTI